MDREKATAVYRVDDKNEWAVGPYYLDDHDGFVTGGKGVIVIPSDQLQGMSAELIGGTVLSLVDAARRSDAIYSANQIVEAINGNTQRAIQQAPRLLHQEELFYEFADQSPVVAEAYFYCVYVRDFLEAREQKIAHVKQERSKTSSHYAKLFVAVGRRDGFKCAACASGDNLQLDHIQAVSQGGSTQLDNLQILCQPCNLKKGQQTIDYRNTQQGDAIQ